MTATAREAIDNGEYINAEHIDLLQKLTPPALKEIFSFEHNGETIYIYGTDIEIYPVFDEKLGVLWNIENLVCTGFDYHNTGGHEMVFVGTANSLEKAFAMAIKTYYNNQTH